MTSRPISPALLCSAALLILTGASLAQPAPPPEQIPGAGSDLRRPPERASEAARPRAPELFVSPSGEPFRGEDGLARWFARADADHDGGIELAEYRADAAAFFKVLDANHDGVVDGFEIEAYEHDIAPEIARYDFDNPQFAEGRGPGGGTGRGGMGGGRGGGGRRGGGEREPQSPSGEPSRPSAAGREGAARFSLINEPEPVSGADEDVNGRVTLAEWMHAADRRFAALDKAKTGKLTLEALRPLLPRQGGRGGRR